MSLETDDRSIENRELVASITDAADYVLDDFQDAREWLTKPHPGLEGRTSLQAAKSEDGARQAKEILDSIFYGLPV